jgi:hypothetical protein
VLSVIQERADIASNVAAGIAVYGMPGDAAYWALMKEQQAEFAIPNIRTCLSCGGDLTKHRLTSGREVTFFR